MSKLWLHTLSQNNLRDIDELTKNVCDLFDGLISVDHMSNDGTYELLEERKKGGEIIRRVFRNDFDITRNIALQSDKLNDMDWIVILDAPERINPDFVKRLHSELIPVMEKEKVDVVFQSTKPVMFRLYKGETRFYSNPHTGLRVCSNQRAIDLNHYPDFKTNGSSIWSLRDPLLSWVRGSQYYLWGYSNHVNLVYEPQRFLDHPRANELMGEHEEVRKKFRNYVRFQLGFEPNKDNLIKYMSNPKDWTNQFLEFVEYEKILKTFYRYYVLQQNYIEIYNTENDWKLKNYLNQIRVSENDS